MSNLNHTPGPWVASEGHPTDVWHVDSDARQFSIVVSRHEADYNMPVEEVQANARLIAAAPELLAALQRLSVLADSAGHPFMKTVAQEAIAKATGGDDE